MTAASVEADVFQVAYLRGYLKILRGYLKIFRGYLKVMSWRSQS
ncbi:hypothetical protein [Eikenella sp. NML080894]|nr:hypothetical protein [Eikenella sp. NML080894]